MVIVEPCLKGAELFCLVQRESASFQYDLSASKNSQGKFPFFFSFFVLLILLAAADEFADPSVISSLNILLWNHSLVEVKFN